MKGLRFADAQESRYQAWNRSYMGSTSCKKVDLMKFRKCVFKFRNVNCAKLQGGRFVHFQEWSFQAATVSYMSSATEQEGRFAEAQESRV